jgi:hypothetical protein
VETAELMLHPLWDSNSEYSRLRACYRPKAKMRGYLHHLAARSRLMSKRVVLPVGPPVEEAAHYALAAKGAIKRIVVAADKPLDELDYAVRPDIDDAIDGRVEVVLLADPKAKNPSIPKAAKCRAFFLDSAVLMNLLEALPGNDRAISSAFKAQVLSNSSAIARILSAVPEMDGMMDVEGYISFTPYSISGIERGSKFPTSMSLVVVANLGR